MSTSTEKPTNQKRAASAAAADATGAAAKRVKTDKSSSSKKADLSTKKSSSNKKSGETSDKSSKYENKNKSKYESKRSPSSSSGSSSSSSSKWPTKSNGDKSGKGGSSRPKVLDRNGRKQLRDERRKAKPNADLIANAKELFTFGLSRMAPEERAAKIRTLRDQTRGHVKELVQKHDASRVFQLMVKYGSTDDRMTLFHSAIAASKPTTTDATSTSTTSTTDATSTSTSTTDQQRATLRTLASNHYAHHFILKLMQYGPVTIRQQVAAAMQGHLHDVVFHADAAKVFDYVYASEKAARAKGRMLVELFSPHFKLFFDDTAHAYKSVKRFSLDEMCAAHPDRVGSMIETMTQLLEKCIEKNLCNFRFVHSLFYQYLTCSALTEAQTLNMINSLATASSSSMLSAAVSPFASFCQSNDGLLLLQHLLLIGTAKDRKAILKAIKPHVATLCSSTAAPAAHLVLLRVFSAVDDTVLVDKQVWAEMSQSAAALKAMMLHTAGNKVLSYLVAPAAATSFLSPFEQQMLQQKQLAASASKKDAIVKQHELLAFALLPVLDAIVSNETAVTHLDTDHKNMYKKPKTSDDGESATATSAATANEDDDDDVDTVTMPDEVHVNGANGDSVDLSLNALLRSTYALHVIVSSVQTACHLLALEEAHTEDGTLSTHIRSAALIKQLPAIRRSLDTVMQRVALELKNDDPESTGLLQDRTAHRGFKRLLSLTSSGSGAAAADAASSSSSAPIVRSIQHTFADAMVQQLGEQRIVAYATINRGAFTLIALLHAASDALRKRLFGMLRKPAVLKRVEAIVSNGESGGAGQEKGPVVGCALLLRVLKEELSLDEASAGFDASASSDRVIASPATSVSTAGAGGANKRKSGEHAQQKQQQQQQKKNEDASKNKKRGRQSA